WRTTTRHDCYATEIYRSSRLRCSVLHANEFFNDRSSARHAPARPFTRELKPGFTVARHRHVRTEFFYRKTHHSIRRSTNQCIRFNTNGSLHRHWAGRCRRTSFLVDVDLTGHRLELRIS